MIYKVTEIEQGSDFWFLIKPEKTDFLNVKVDVLNSNGKELLSIDLVEGGVEIIEDGYIAKIDKEWTETAQFDNYNTRLSFVEVTGKTTIKTVKNFFKICK